MIRNKIILTLVINVMVFSPPNCRKCILGSIRWTTAMRPKSTGFTATNALKLTHGRKKGLGRIWFKHMPPVESVWRGAQISHRGLPSNYKSLMPFLTSSTHRSFSSVPIYANMGLARLSTASSLTHLDLTTGELGLLALCSLWGSRQQMLKNWREEHQWKQTLPWDAILRLHLL